MVQKLNFPFLIYWNCHLLIRVRIVYIYSQPCGTRSEFFSELVLLAKKNLRFQLIKLDISTFEPSMFCLLELYLFFHSLSYKAFWERSSLFKGCLPSKEVFHRWLSSFIKGFRPSNVVFHQRLSSIKLVFHQILSSFKGHLPSKVALHQRSFFYFG